MKFIIIDLEDDIEVYVVPNNFDIKNPIPFPYRNGEYNQFYFSKSGDEEIAVYSYSKMYPHSTIGPAFIVFDGIGNVIHKQYFLEGIEISEEIFE